MPRPPSTPWPTEQGTVFFAGEASTATLSRARKAGRIRRLASGLYTADLANPDQELISRNRWLILSHFIPDAILADRSAAEGGVPSAGYLFVISDERVRDLELPGLTLCPRKGHPALTDDLPWSSGLRLTSDARTLVDNLARSRAHAGRPARTLTRAELEDWLVRKTQLRGEEWLPQVRTRALAIAEQIGASDRAAAIEDLVGAVGGTRPARKNAGPLLRSHALRKAWDPARIERFEQVAAYLADIPEEAGIPRSLPIPAGDPDGHLPFFEAYFSNFIEGTEFSVEEAEGIIARREIPAARPEDAHDILGTYEVVSDPIDRIATPADSESLLELLKSRHRRIMSGRPQMNPGRFKIKANQAGSYVFVAPDLVEGTLIEGLRAASQLPPGFARAAYQLFLISEVHPFDDGNGRVARAAMCAELSAADQSRIIVPTVFRNDYLTALRVLSRDGLCDVYVRALAHAWRWTASMPWSEWPASLGALEATNALVDSTDAERSGVRLRIP